MSLSLNQGESHEDQSPKKVEGYPLTRQEVLVDLVLNPH